MTATELLAHINSRHGTTYSLGGKCAGGTRGAYEVVDAQSNPAIFKFGPDSRWLARLHQAEHVAARLRRVGYPTPRNLAVGVGPDGHWYQLQQFVVGVPIPGPLSPEHVQLLLALNDLQAAHHPPPGAGWADWSRHARDVVFADASGWASALHACSPQTRNLLHALQARARPFVATPLPTDDVVHGDFLPENVLVRDGRVAAVIDTAALGYGPRVLDLARVFMWWYADMDHAARRLLRERIAAIATPAERAICLACQIIDVLAFVIEYHPGDVGAMVERGHAVLAAFRED